MLLLLLQLPLVSVFRPHRGRHLHHPPVRYQEQVRRRHQYCLYQNYQVKLDLEMRRRRRH
jgi:hypothetical protein